MTIRTFSITINWTVKILFSAVATYAAEWRVFGHAFLMKARIMSLPWRANRPCNPHRFCYVNLTTEIKPKYEVGILFCLVQRLRINGALLLLLPTYQHALVEHKGKLTVGAYEMKTIKRSARLQKGRVAY